MARRPSSQPPSYRLHKQSGQAIVTLPDGLGGRRDILLGPHDTPESRAEYDRVIAEWLASGRRSTPRPEPGQEDGISTNELILAFWSHVETYYRKPNGTPTSEQDDYRLSLRPLKHLYGSSPATKFGPLALKAVRQLMVDGYEHPEHGPQQTLARGVINQRVGRIVRMFKWAVAEELVPVEVFQALEAVPGLQKGRSKARETVPVKPVAQAIVDATLPFLLPQVQAMVQLQLHSGMRPGEVVRIRGLDLDTSGTVWFYRPGSDEGPTGDHKTAWRGQEKIIALGPKAQEIVRAWLRLKVDEYLFQPREAMAAFRAEQRSRRKTKVQPSQKNRKKARPRKLPRDRYDTRSYAQAISKGIVKANTASACDPCKALKPEERCETCRAAALPHWHPHQLRHTKATEIRREYGLDAARAVLGHRSPKITEVYAEIDVSKAAEVMERIG
jgi:integrase